MSRGNREASLGNLKNSMRDNYTEHGVDEVSVRIGVVDRAITKCAHRLPAHSTTRKWVRLTATHTSLESKRVSICG